MFTNEGPLHVFYRLHPCFYVSSSPRARTRLYGRGLTLPFAEPKVPKRVETLRSRGPESRRSRVEGLGSDLARRSRTKLPSVGGRFGTVFLGLWADDHETGSYRRSHRKELVVDFPSWLGFLDVKSHTLSFFLISQSKNFTENRRGGVISEPKGIDFHHGRGFGEGRRGVVV